MHYNFFTTYLSTTMMDPQDLVKTYFAQPQPVNNIGNDNQVVPWYNATLYQSPILHLIDTPHVKYEPQNLMTEKPIYKEGEGEQIAKDIEQIDWEIVKDFNLKLQHLQARWDNNNQEDLLQQSSEFCQANSQQYRIKLSTYLQFRQFINSLLKYLTKAVHRLNQVDQLKEKANILQQQVCSLEQDNKRYQSNELLTLLAPQFQIENESLKTQYYKLYQEKQHLEFAKNKQQEQMEKQLVSAKKKQQKQMEKLVSENQTLTAEVKKYSQMNGRCQLQRFVFPLWSQKDKQIESLRVELSELNGKLNGCRCRLRQGEDVGQQWSKSMDQLTNNNRDQNQQIALNRKRVFIYPQIMVSEEQRFQTLQ